MKKNNVVNHSSMKQLNLLTVLNLLRRNGAMSRAELTRALCCDGTTITNITRELMEHNLVLSRGPVNSSSPGRPKELLEVNPSAKQVIGISFAPRFLCGVITDLNGKVILHEEIHFETEISRKKFLALLQSLCSKLLSNVSEKQLLGVGIGTFGPLLPGKNIVMHTGSFPVVENLDIKDYFSKQFKIAPVILDSSSAKVMTELWHDTREDEKKNFILIDAGIGLGAIIVTKGRLLNSEDEYIGEFGHTVYMPNGETCKCGLKGCLETLAAIPAIERKIAAKLKLSGISFDTVVAKYQEGVPSVKAIIESSAEWLGISVANLINLLVPGKIIFSGPLLELGDEYFHLVRKKAEEFTFPVFRENQIPIQKSKFGTEAAAQGAAIYLLQKYFDGESQL